MDKFLDLVEDHKPDKDYDKITDAKRSLQRFLMKKKIRSIAHGFQDNILVQLDDGRVVKLEVKDIDNPGEDQETETANTTKDVELAAATAKKGVSGAIAGAMGTVAQKAKKAVERRKKVIKAQLPKKIAEYEAATNELEK
jgi:hypothetical protein